ncbi:MAG: protein kinase [Elusimicrobia bacterium]|nr:protein kinase [Elusimicrobiota bacterium]
MRMILAAFLMVALPACAGADEPMVCGKDARSCGRHDHQEPPAAPDLPAEPPEDHRKGDEDELLPLKPEQKALLEVKWPGTFEKFHRVMHELVDNLPGQDSRRRYKPTIITEVNHILMVAAQYVKLEDDFKNRVISAQSHDSLLEKYRGQMEKSGERLDHLPLPRHERGLAGAGPGWGDPRGHEANPASVHNIVMKAGLDSIMNSVIGAKNHADHTIHNNPPNPYNWSQGGDAYLKEGDAKKAVEYYTKAIQLDPGHFEALKGRAAAQYELKNYREASQDAKAALKIDPSDSQALALAQLSHEVGGKAPSGAAVPAWNSSESQDGAPGEGFGGLAASPKAAAAAETPVVLAQSARYAQQARHSLGLGDYQDAIAQATRAIELNAMNAQALYMRSAAYAKTRLYDKASEDAEAGLKLDPKNGPLLDAKAAALNRLKRYREALQAANAALEVNPKDAAAHYLRAMALAGLAERDPMQESLKAAAALDPRYGPILEAALQLPEDADLLFLFPEEGRAAPRSAPARRSRLVLVALAVAAGALLLAFGAAPFFMPSLRTRIQTGRWPNARPPEPGVIGGQYRLSRQIGIGGMGQVYEGTDVSLNRRVAVKRMREELRQDPRERERFLSEARLVAALHHPHIVDIYAIVEDQEEVYLIFEFVPGKTVYDLAGAHGRLDWSQTLEILRGVAEALDYAHSRRVIHRDLKPSNIMVTQDGQAKVMDFGIARMAKDAASRRSLTNTVVGTPPYMAPEQEQGEVGRAADIYSLGVCLYEMLSGQMPFQGSGAGMFLNKVQKNYTPLTKAASGLPEGLDEVLAKALDPDPGRRFASAGELMAALEDLSPGRVLG